MIEQAVMLGRLRGFTSVVPRYACVPARSTSWRSPR